MANNIAVCRDGFVDMDNFKDFIDVSRVCYYSLKVNKDETITVKFYDKNKKLVKPKTDK